MSSERSRSRGSRRLPTHRQQPTTGVGYFTAGLICSSTDLQSCSGCIQAPYSRGSLRCPDRIPFPHTFARHQSTEVRSTALTTACLMSISKVWAPYDNLIYVSGLKIQNIYFVE